MKQNVKTGAAVLIINSSGQVLLMLRDDEASLRAKFDQQWLDQWLDKVHHKGMWDTFGGLCEEGETPELAARREVGEELLVDGQPLHITDLYHMLLMNTCLPRLWGTVWTTFRM